MSSESLGVVVIGRNEGDRLLLCLRSITDVSMPLIYVDSGSSDGSLESASRLRATAIALDTTRPFTAARARNAGLQQLMVAHPDCRHVQFVDGDCELNPDWLQAGLNFLEQHPEVAAVAGRLRERFPEKSIFNRLCDLEWDTPTGSVAAVGGIAMFRASVLKQAGGFREDLIAGEEPELCVRLRGAGWQVHRLAQEMAWHDADMTRWSQWWRRTVRAGFSFAEGRHLHGAPPTRHYVREVRRAVTWGMALPLLCATASLLMPFGAVSWSIYGFQALRIGLRARRQGKPTPWLYGAMLVAARLPEALGVVKFWATQLSGRRSSIIEYK